MSFFRLFQLLYYLSGTFFATGSAPRTLSVIDDGNVVLHNYRAFGTIPDARAAAYTTGFTHKRNVPSLTRRRARDVNLRVLRNSFYELFRTSHNARAAAYTLS